MPRTRTLAKLPGVSVARRALGIVNSLLVDHPFMKLLAATPTGEPLGIGRPTTNQLRILPITMQPGEELIVGNRLRQVLDKAGKQSA